jgi:glycosyltransferase involved in cell wall biosynthesis
MNSPIFQDRKSKEVTEPMVSVVTPFYNTDKYLTDSIESVLNQSYENWEYILVNNCSTDKSYEIAYDYAKSDSRIKVYSNDIFLSQVENYNRSLKLISSDSKYCKMVQADDWIFPNCLMEMVKVAESDCSVGIVGAYRIDDKLVNCDGLPYPSTVVSGKEICRQSLLKGLAVFGSVTSLLLRSDIVRSRYPFFCESSRHEDTEACFEILKNYNFGFVHKVLTFTRRENESISSTIRRYDPYYFLAMYIIIQKYGLYYLDESEFNKRYDDIKKKYYKFLAEKILVIKDKKELLKYHDQGLNYIGKKLSIYETGKYLLMACIKKLLDLNNLVRLLLKGFIQEKK